MEPFDGRLNGNLLDWKVKLTLYSMLPELKEYLGRHGIWMVSFEFPQGIPWQFSSLVQNHPVSIKIKLTEWLLEAEGDDLICDHWGVLLKVWLSLGEFFAEGKKKQPRKIIPLRGKLSIPGIGKISGFISNGVFFEFFLKEKFEWLQWHHRGNY